MPFNSLAIKLEAKDVHWNVRIQIGPSGHHANQTACYHEQETLKEISTCVIL